MAVLRKKTPYPEIKCPGHPLARADGWGAAHRIALYDAIGPGPHQCTYCGRELHWYGQLPPSARPKDYLAVDHQDGWSLNGKLSNLAPSCVACNSRRGADNSTQWELLRQVELPSKVPVSRYRRLKRRGHPLATQGGHLSEHRAILYEKLGPGIHSCHWCGRSLRWTKRSVKPDSILPDHVDGNTRNNDPGNIVPACPRCNARRRRTYTLAPGEVWGFRTNGVRFRGKATTCAHCGAQLIRPVWDGLWGRPRFCGPRCKMLAGNAARGQNGLPVR